LPDAGEGQSRPAEISTNGRALPLPADFPIRKPAQPGGEGAILLVRGGGPCRALVRRDADRDVVRAMTLARRSVHAQHRSASRRDCQALRASSQRYKARDRRGAVRRAEPAGRTGQESFPRRRASLAPVEDRRRIRCQATQLPCRHGGSTGRRRSPPVTGPDRSLRRSAQAPGTAAGRCVTPAAGGCRGGERASAAG